MILSDISCMHRIAVVLALSLQASIQLLWTPTAFAGAQGDPQKCDGSTAEMVDCLKAQTAEWDKRMTIAYEKAMKEASPQQHDQLRAAQRLWIQYRDANCLYYGMGEGTIARIDAGECMRSMTEARARELEGLGHQ
jgi:uncharacterized protein YecT (DUF1311 family)